MSQMDELSSQMEVYNQKGTLYGLWVTAAAKHIS